MKLAGETGELVDMIAKRMYKPGWSESSLAYHRTLEELGDCWFYYRVLAAMAQMPSTTRETLPGYATQNISGTVSHMYYTAATIFLTVQKAHEQRAKEETLYVIGHKLPSYYTCLERISSRYLKVTIEMLTEVNWEKLKEGGNGYLVDKTKQP
jgi:hypothetical protein